MNADKAIVLPPPAHHVVQEFMALLTHINDDFIAGVYLTGSLPLHDYQPGKSDIDFVVLCKRVPDKALIRELVKVHRRLEQQFPETGLNGTYLTYDSLQAQDIYAPHTLYYHEGVVHTAHFSMAPITLLELKTTAVTLTGPPARNLPIAVAPEDVNAFLYKNMNTYWKGWISGNSLFSRLKLLLFPRVTEWIILGMARQLYTLRTGAITSKTGAGYYCLAHLPTEYHAIIQQAMAIRQNGGAGILSVRSSYHIQPSLKRTAATLSCARYILHLFNKEYTADW